jgi:3'-phosphoadenosine 5'-phosphosulfate sulfotransferase (PAPS reductase)/FAD synthetase
MLKVEPMERAMRAEREALGHKLLLVTGLRIGESAARDLFSFAAVTAE